jgi:hypothetical protein
MKLNFMKAIFYLLLLMSFKICPISAWNPSEDIQPIEKKYELVICALFRDEAFFLKEWLEFHKLMGVQHFYLYNNLSQDEYIEILMPYILAGEVELFDWPVETYQQLDYLNFVQLPIYNHALKIAQKTAHWAAFIDLDEFLFPVKSSDLVSFLQDYRAFAGLVVNWQAYGTGGIDSLSPQGLITENLVWKAPTYFQGNHMIKSIVQPLLVSMISDPHSFFFVGDYFAVNANGEPIPPGQSSHPVIAIDRIRINHYWFGTKNWFLQNKIPRRARWGLSFTPEYIESLIESCNQERDESILRFTPQLRKRIYPNNDEKEPAISILE